MGQIISRGHAFSPNHPVLPDLIAAIAEAEGQRPTELTPPLFDVIDPDALELLVQESASGVCVQFEYRGRSITVQSDGIISISGDSHRKSLYQYECHTCEEERLFDSQEGAQAVFSEHADQLHEVVFRRVEAPSDQVATEIHGGDPAAESSTQAPEPSDSHLVDE